MPSLPFGALRLLLQLTHDSRSGLAAYVCTSVCWLPIYICLRCLLRFLLAYIQGTVVVRYVVENAATTLRMDERCVGLIVQTRRKLGLLQFGKQIGRHIRHLEKCRTSQTGAPPEIRMTLRRHAGVFRTRTRRMRVEGFTRR